VASWLTSVADPVQTLGETDVEVATLPTIEDVSKERQRRKAEMEAAQQKEEISAREAAGGAAPSGGVEQLEEEAGQQGAFNPETGEINWDCPCLGGMADGPCGEQFKAAFSCFVYSTEEPKGMDCIEKFKYA
jgi:intermembrane space import and assembly protein 40